MDQFQNWDKVSGPSLLLLIRLFGANPKILPAINYQHDLLPQPYVAHRDSTILEQNTSASLRLLSVPCSDRNFLIVLDETYYHPTQDIIANLRGDSKLAVIGGYYHSEEDCRNQPTTLCVVGEIWWDCVAMLLSAFYLFIYFLFFFYISLFMSISV